jgi:O-antigen/teichoic acid export membrane protein
LLKDLKYTIKHSGIYGLSRVASKALSFVFIPLYTSVYSAEGIASINLLETFWQYLLTVCLFGFEATIITHCANLQEDERKKSLFNFFSILLVNCLVFLIGGVLFKQNIAGIMFNQPQYSNVIFYCFLIGIFESLITIPLCIARLKNKPGLYSTIALSSLFINFFLQIYFVYFAHKDFDFIFIAKFIAPAAVFVVTIPFVISNLKIDFNKANIKHIVDFSFFWMLYAIMSILLNTVDRYILVEYVSLEQIGIYTQGYSIGSLTNALIVAPFTLAFSGIFFKKAGEENSARYFTKMSTYLFFAMIFVSLVAALIIPEAIKIFVRNPKLWNAVTTIRIILFANCISSLFNVIGLAFLYKKESRIVTWYTLIALVFNVAGNFIFIRYFGIYAAGVLSVLSYLLLIVMLYEKSKKYYFVKFEIYKLSLLSVLYIGLVYLSALTKTSSLFLNSLLDIALIILFFVLLYVGRFFESIELYTIKGAINKYFKINLFRKTL